MFRNDLKDKLQAIFGFQKVTFDAPSDSFEQEVAFVEVNDCRTAAAFGHASARVNGTVTVYTQSNKLPFGFFNKKIQQADHSLTKDFFFFNLDVDVANSPARLQNICERRASFVYLHSAQYDPDQGSMTSVSFELGE